jgi:ankyrin repeat protein
LIENGAKVNATDYEKGTALMRAARRPNSNPECLRVLIKNGAAIEMTDKQGKFVY